jgi:rod shape-determining protein MreC
MRNIFLFIRRYFTAITFLALEVLALWLLFTYNRFHRAKGLGWANELTGRINRQYNKVEDFFNQKEENRRLHHFNDSLLNLLQKNFVKPDNNKQLVTDSILYDTSGKVRRYYWREAQVIYNTVNAQKNYIQLSKGSNQGIKDNMAVISSNGAVVGTVLNVSANFSQVMSLLHVQQNVNATLKKSGDFGTIEWDGKNPQLLTLKRIPNYNTVEIGDTVLTSSYSFNFPPGLMIGTIAEIIKDKSTNFFTLKVKPAANFFNLQQVFVIENLQYGEQVDLFQETKKKIEENKKSQK